ncbi:UPF0271 protein [Tenacibaculum sp. MAR_2010_89]|nr:UPF0271 protein [Tenacibaculum sp. MAR_2010_89]
MFFNMKIDINCDVGEGVGNEELLMPYISSCNIACTAHAGTIETIDAVIQLAKENNVKIGAHPSFPDKENFGRKIMDISTIELQKSVEWQINLLKERVKIQKSELNHIKFHGALYNLVAKNKEIAEVVIQSILKVSPATFLYVPFNSKIAEIAEKENIKIKYEAFADRNYNDDSTLVSRSLSNAVINDKSKAFNHVFRMLSLGELKTTNGKLIKIKADTFCVHGDTENAIELVSYIYKSMQKKGITIA